MNQNQNQEMAKLPLPPEIIVHISKYLNIKDKLKLRLINKSFKFVFDYLISINCLTLVQSDEGICPNWFYTNKSNNNNELIKFNDINAIKNLFKIDYLIKNIQKLFFYSFSGINLNNTINQLENLEELNITYYEVGSNLIIKLPKLKILSIKQSNSFEEVIKLETPSLSFLKCDYLKNYQFNYAEKLIYLETRFINYTHQNIEKFRNLEYSISYSFMFESEFSPNFLIILKNLKELHFNGKEYLKKDLNKLEEIYQHKLKLKLNNLKLFQ